MQAGDQALRRARAIALVVPLALLGGAYLSQYGFGLFPCEICWWQRYALFAAVPLALLAYLQPPGRVWIALAGLAIAVSAAIGGWHAGIENRWWEGLTACTSLVGSGQDPLEAVLNAPMVRCDEAQWRLLGISLAGWNFLISGAAAIAIAVLLGRSNRKARA